jgi:mRNA deadenylase 3'-5' endonuclease subunit Ccr4
MKQIVALQHLDEEAFDIYNCEICKKNYDIQYYKKPPKHSVPVGDIEYSKTNIKLPLVD